MAHTYDPRVLEWDCKTEAILAFLNTQQILNSCHVQLKARTLERKLKAVLLAEFSLGHSFKIIRCVLSDRFIISAAICEVEAGRLRSVPEAGRLNLSSQLLS